MKKQSTNRKQMKKSTARTQSKTQSTSSPDRTITSVENGITLLKYAVRNKMSVSEAARENGFGRNYVSDVKSRIEQNYKNRSISRDLYNSFKTSAKNYEKVS